MSKFKKAWVPIRDYMETNAVLAGNYLLPGSATLTKNLASEGSQKQLNSPLGQLGQAASGLTGAGVGSSFTGVPSASSVGAGWGNTFSKIGASTGLSGALSGITGNSGWINPDTGSLAQGSGSGIAGLFGGGGSGLFGNGTPSAGGATSAGGGSSGFGGFGGSNILTSALSGILGTNANNDARDDLLEQQRKNQELYSPFLTAKFDSSNLQNDPGYLFAKEQGTKAADRKNLATGNYFSGEALREAQEFGTGLADSTYNQGYNRWLADMTQKMQAAGLVGGTNENIGNIQANAGINNSNLLTGAGANLFGGNSVNNTGVLSGGSNSDFITRMLREELLKNQGGGLSSYGV